MKLWHKVTLGLALGIILGLISKEHSFYITPEHIANFIKPIGDIFLNLIKMIITPLIFFSLASGITSMSDPSSLGRVSMKASFAFLTTTAFAILIGFGVAFVLKPGEGIDLGFLSSSNDVVYKHFDVAKFIIDIVPSNAVAALAGSNTLQVVFFAIFTGITLNKIDGPERRLIDVFHMMAKLTFKMISLIMNFSPYGAFALTAWVTSTQGVDVLHSLGKLIFAVIMAMGLQYLIFGLLILIFAKMSPIPFYRKSAEYQTLAFSTSSSKAALATTMKVCHEKMGISKNSTSFILPLGASINMDGMAIYLGMCTIFFAQATNTVLHMHDYIIIILTATLGSIGGAGIPGTSMVMLPMILAAVHMPIEGVALIAGIDRILDMLRTTINITGDATITLIIDKTEGTLDEKTYMSQ